MWQYIIGNIVVLHLSSYIMTATTGIHPRIHDLFENEIGGRIVDPQTINHLFENEIEGQIADPESIHILFMDDTLNERMDRKLREDESGFWTRFFRKFI